MIRLLDGEFEPWELFSARVLAARRSYKDIKESQFWLQELCRGGNFAARAEKLGVSGGPQAAPTAVCSIADGFAILAAKEDADWEELITFLRMQPWLSLQCGAEIAARLPFPIDWTSILVKYAAPGQAGDIAPAGGPGEVYDILAQCFPGMKNRNDWMADLALRWRRGTAKSWVLEGQCTASALAVAEHYAFLGAVGTLPGARGRGLAGRLLTHVAAEMAGREVWLSCREELRGFYESIGFVGAGKMATVKKEAI